MLSVTSGHGAEYLLGSVSSGRESYYLDATTDGEPPGQWSGAGADAFGLEGEVIAKDMEALYGGFADPRDPRFADPALGAECDRLGSAPRHFRSADEIVTAKLEAHPGALPEDIAAWRVQAERDSRSAVMFEDATFGIPKSVTVLHAAFQKAELEAQRDGDDSAAAQWAGRRAKVESAIHTGNAAMLSFMADKAGYARTGGDRSGRATRHIDAHGWVVGSFFQHTNRDLEPHLHIHNAILNRTVVEDGRALALDGKAIRFWKQAGGTLAERVMQEELSRSLGLQWQLNAKGHTREIVGVDQDVVDLFSGRTAKITKKSAELIRVAEARLGRGLTPLEHNRIRNQATLATRQAKSHEGETTEQMLDRWHAKLQQELAGGLHRVAGQFSERGEVSTDTEFSPAAVVAQALDAVQESRATWTRPELMRRIDLALPDNLGGIAPEAVIALITRLTDAAIASSEVIQTSGQALGEVPDELRRTDGTSVYESPRAQRYVTREHVLAEEALRRAAVDRGRFSVPVKDVDGWLRARSDMLGADQAAAVRGIATSGAGLAALVGPAGAGKSHTAGALAAAWGDLTGGQFVGIATTQVATEVLIDDGVHTAANTRAWLNAQQRLADGTASPADDEWRIDSRSIVLVDEASMMSTRDMTAVREAVDRAGARMVLAGDPAQLGAVGAGGMMALLANGEADTYSLSDVRRFHDRWERAASLRLRDGEAAVLREYDRHGRILDGGTPAEAMEAAARGYVADRVAGKTSVIVAGTNDQAAEMSTMVRERLVGLGLVEAEGLHLERDGSTAGVGDIVAARRIDWGLGVLNRRQYEVTEVRDDGSMTVVSVTTGSFHDLPPDYVREHVSLGYAGTVHSTQGQTVDTSHDVLDRTSTREAAYVALTRGQESNTAYVVTIEGRDPLATNIDVPAPEPRTAVAVLADVLERDSAERSATAETREQAEWAASAATIDARLEDAVRLACRERTDRALDRLVEDGLMSEGQRARLGADQGTEYLSRVLRAVEQAGHDQEQVLRETVAGRDLQGVRSVAQVLSARITSTTDLTVSGEAMVPGGLSPTMTAYVAELHERGDARRAELGEAAANEPPAWALAAFGPAPAGEDARSSWVERVSAVAAHREASGWDSEDAAVGPAPGLQATERRASWHEAWDALGRPQAQAEEGDLSEGRLRNRVEAWNREQAWAPHFADDHLKASSLTASSSDREATLADAEGREDDFAKLADEAATARLAADALDGVARERGRWVVSSVATRETSVRAEAELEARGIVIGEEPDRTTPSDYLLEVVEDEDGPTVVQREVPRPALERVVPAADIPTAEETASMVERAEWVGEVLNDRKSQDEAHLGDGEWAAVDEESRAWEAAEGHEEAVVMTDAVAHE